MSVTNEELKRMNEEAEKVIRNWTFGAFAANLLPPPFDIITVGAVFAKLGHRLGEVYQVPLKWPQLKRIGMSIAKGIGAVMLASFIGSALFKFIPGVNIWVALLIQPPIVAAISYCAGKTFIKFYNLILVEDVQLSPEEVRGLAEGYLKGKLAS